jgi:hypothetical protein
MTFVGVDFEPVQGRDEIAAAYAQMPPDDTMVVQSVATDGSRDLVRFSWSRGGMGTMDMHWDGDHLSLLTVSFDSGPADGDD